MKIIVALLLITATANAQVKNWYQSQPNSKYGIITESVIQELKNTAPALFAALDTLKIPVYIKVLDESDMHPVAAGLTTINAQGVFIRISASNRASRVLAHEFGHAVYQVQHPEYAAFQIKRYTDRADIVLGHDSDDLSGKSAMLFENTYVSLRKK